MELNGANILQCRRKRILLSDLLGDCPMGSAKEKLWPLEPHTTGKHLVLRAYLNAWLPILSSGNSRVLFIDGFAGPGEYAGGEEGYRPNCNEGSR